MSWLHFAVLAPFLSTLAIPALAKLFPRLHIGWIAMILPLGLFIFFIGHFPIDTSGAPILHSLSWVPSLHIDFSVYLDGLGLLFALIITGIGFLVVLYSIFYMSREREELARFYIYLFMFMGAMLGIVLSDHLIVLYVFWEVTSISSFLLITYWYQRKNSREGALKSMFITMCGGFAMLLGFLLLYGISGTFHIRELIEMAANGELADHAWFIPAMLLILAGAFTKSAQYPFHIWLPGAMEAPTPVSAYLHSATMVKAGIYLIARLTPVFAGHSPWFIIITVVGMITLFWGAFMGVRQFDLKAMLAYSTISQLGLIVSLMGIGSLAYDPQFSAQKLLLTGAFLAAIFHLVNHAIFKGALFMMVGILDHGTGTRDTRKLGGLMSIMPISFTMTAIGGFSMAGLPPFSGFLSKEMFFQATVLASQNLHAWFVILPIVAWIASIFTFTYCTILIFEAFTGPFKPEQFEITPHEASFGMLTAPAILTSAVILLFFFPNLISETLLEPVMASIMPHLLANGDHFHVHISVWHGFNIELFMTIGVVIFGILLYRSYLKWAGVYTLLPRKFTLNDMYDSFLKKLEGGSRQLTRAYMTGFTRDYLMYIFLFMMIVAGASLFLLDAFTFNLSTNSTIHVYEYVLGLSVVGAAIYMLFSRSRIISIFAVGAIGYLISLLLVIFRAPDLALTQLVVETITTVIFLLCFFYLPKLRKEMVRLPFRMMNVVISLGVGFTFTCIGLAALDYQVFETITYFFEDADVLAGARNIVNAILVDFRGFDTMLEIVVLFLAGIGVYTLVHLRNLRGEDE